MEPSSLFWKGVAFDRWTTDSRTAGVSSNNCTVLPRLFAVLHSPLPPLWESWISAESPFRLSLNPLCSVCALMLVSQPRILVVLEFFEVGASIVLASKGK